MADNTVRSLENEAQVEVMLDIVGMAHLKGMVKILTEEYGFTEISFGEIRQQQSAGIE